MNFWKLSLLLALVLLLSQVEAKRKRKYSDHGERSNKTKTKTKWSTTTDLGASGDASMVATEEHGYYVKRTYQPLSNASGSAAAARQSPPYLAIPIAWFSCASTDAAAAADCQKSNALAINGAAQALLAGGFLCDDDCAEPYEPICGKTASEVAVFYNKCKLNVAKCRTHGLWLDLPYAQCAASYAAEVAYADQKFRSSPYFKAKSATVAVLPTPAESATIAAAPQPPPVTAEQEESIVGIAMEALSEINEKLTEAQTAADDEEKLLEHTTERSVLPPARENEVAKQQA